jgi:proteasome alpha subunit
MSLDEAVRAAVAALGSTSASPPGPEQLEAAALERSRPRRTFRRMSADRLAGILGVDRPAPPSPGVADSPDLPSVGGEVP